ncbi:VTT domain-containing protein [Limibaculum sp. FT325]|uniref:TVP38/TMEM64 family protein n=1 Tax=Thermohalobaculum sediminis TaxID=2939436 RepID=UPI0020BF916D|nr:VTT domain-containing protein [Limibaculum sediminis]MCL5776936.1 VTT domain-containing protein [Limibaculum sediminis]
MSLAELVRRDRETDDAPRRTLLRWLPMLLIAAGAVAALLYGRDYLSFDALAENRDTLAAFRDQNFALSVALYMGLYIAAVAFSVPGAVWLTIAGGFLFGTALATAATVLSATIGAIMIFCAARTSLGAVLHEKAGRWLDRIEAGFREGEVSYLLIMRLVPAVPFFVANLAPAFLGVRLRTFSWTTLVGIVPGTAVYASVGAGLGGVLDLGGKPDLGVIFTPTILGPLVGLAALSALPVVVRKLRGPRA